MGILSTLASGANKIAAIAAENSQPILTIVEWGSVAGAMVTGIRSTIRVTRAVDNENRYRAKNDIPLMTGGEIARAAIPEYASTAVFLMIFGGANILKAHFNQQQLATLAALYSLEKTNSEEYKRKTRELFGERKEQRIRDEVNADIARNVNTQTIVMYGGSMNGSHPCMFSWSKTGPFLSNKNAIESIKNEANSRMINNFEHITAKEFYQAFGIPEDQIPEYAYNAGWNTDHLIDLYYTTGTTADGVPMLMIGFREEPDPDYLKTI